MDDRVNNPRPDMTTPRPCNVVTGALGFESDDLSTLTDSGSDFWSFGGGILLTRYRDRLQDRNLQRLAGIAAIATVLLAWITAFGG